MTPQLDTIIIQVSSVKELSLRANPTGTIQDKTFATNEIGPMVTQDFTLAKLANLMCLRLSILDSVYLSIA